MAERDPYQVLGVSPSASDEEIKKAYRALVRKYHPDKYQDSDLKDVASEKMKEVNAAYEAIEKMRAGGGSAGGNQQGGAYGGYGAYGGQSSYSTNPRYAEIRRLINAGNVVEAAARLSEIDAGDRGAEWHFLMGCVAVRRGSFVDAQNYFDKACAMDPRNPEYHNARESLRRRANTYGASYRTAQSDAGCSGCDICQGLLCADCCCECMGGDLIRCC